MQNQSVEIECLKLELAKQHKIQKQCQDNEATARKEALDLVVKLNMLQHSTVDWENVAVDTRIEVADQIGSEDYDWKRIHFYAYLPQAEFPILCIHPECAPGVRGKDRSKLNQEHLFAYKYGRLIEP